MGQLRGRAVPVLSQRKALIWLAEWLPGTMGREWLGVPTRARAGGECVCVCVPVSQYGKDDDAVLGFAGTESGTAVGRAAVLSRRGGNR